MNRDDSYSVVNNCDNRDIVCFSCKKHGHYAWACPRKVARRIRVILEVESQRKSIIEEFEECLKRKRITRHIVQTAPPNENLFFLLRKLNKDKHFIYNINLDKYIDQRMNELDDEIAKKYEKGSWKEEEIQKQAKQEIIEEVIATDKGLAAENDPKKNKQMKTFNKVAEPKSYRIQTKQEKDTEGNLAEVNKYKNQIKEVDNKIRTLENEIKKEKESWFYIDKTKIEGLKDKIDDLNMEKAAIIGEINFISKSSKPKIITSQIKPCTIMEGKLETKPVKNITRKEEIKKKMVKTREDKIKKGKFNRIVRQEMQLKEEKEKKIKELKDKLASMDEEEKEIFKEQMLEEKRERDLQRKTEMEDKDVDYDLQL